MNQKIKNYGIWMSVFIFLFSICMGQTVRADSYITAKNWPKGPSVNAEAAVLIDATNGQVLYEKNPDEKLYPASITKIMTALLALENTKLTDTVTAKGDGLTKLPPGYVSIAISNGEQMKAEDWLQALLLYSANDAANVLGAHIGGSLNHFADMMNERAKKAGAKNTHFENPSGLHSKNHYTTAYDMAMILKDCVANEDFLKIAGNVTYELQPNNTRKQAFRFYNRHQMLIKSNKNYYEYALAGKTGYTTQAKNTLVTYAQKDGMKLICCVMKCGEGMAYPDTKTLFEYGFNNFSLCEVSKKDTRYTLTQAGIFSSLNTQSSPLSITIGEGCEFILPNGVKLEDLDTKLEYVDHSTSNDGFATVTYSYEGENLGTAKLYLNVLNADKTTDMMQIFSDNTIYISIWYVAVPGVILAAITTAFVMKHKKNKNKLSF
ncbi:D-alanyl-D-alanine carboxypeptidase [Lachnospiraceae bacterium TWA4]|nr:D-alanyl-D-alanine carboxypeptidase [Lachnospiraceae bacterium TWA4]